MLVKGAKSSLLAPSLFSYMLLSMTGFTTGVFFLDYIGDFNMTNNRIGTKSEMIAGLGLFILSFIIVGFLYSDLWKHDNISKYLCELVFCC